MPDLSLMQLPDQIICSKYSGKRGIGHFRPMTFYEVKNLQYGSRVWALTQSGDAREVKINGRPQTWKRNPLRVRVPWKYGMYEYGAYTETDGIFFLIEVA